MRRARNKHSSNKKLTSRELANLTPGERIEYKRRLREEAASNSKSTSSENHTLKKLQGMKKNSTSAGKKGKKKFTKEQQIFMAKLRVYLVIGICILVVVLLGVGAGMYAAVSQEIADKDFDSIANNFSSIVFAEDKNGNTVEVEYLHSDGNREWIESDQIPDIVKEAAIAIEDERFLSHKGVDLKRTSGATLGWFVSKITGKEPSYGGSTITQQLVKNIYNEKERTVTRKIKEMMRATALEKRLTKDEILTLYLNVVYFGNQCYGIEPASKIYFSKNARDLTLPEAAMIVGITQAPSKYNPFKNPENTIAKRNTVLKKMYELEKISEQEYNKAIESPLGVNSEYNSMGSSIYSYFVDQVITDVISDLQTKKGYSKAFASQQIFSGGLKIYTTMNIDIQNAMEDVYTNKANFPSASSGVQSAMVIIDPKTGGIKGMVGGIGQKVDSRGLNRATQAKRQPGSSIKPLSVYAPSLESGKITAATIITDEAITLGEWSPKNSYSGFKGDLSVRRAIEISANIPAVKTLQTLGVESSYNFMTNKLHFTTLVNNDKNYSSLALGGLTSGVSPKEMAAAYAVFANKGIYTTPHTYTKVVDSHGKVLLETQPKTSRVLSEANAFIMTSFLREVVNGGSGTGRNARITGHTVYGKTGTSNDNKDKWFVGFTGNYVGATWYGFDDYNKSVGSSNVSTLVWKKVMQKVHQGVQAVEISRPSTVTAVSVCQRTGKLSSEGCPYGNTEYFTRGTLPSKYCENTGHFENMPTDDPDASPTPSTSPDAIISPEESPSQTIIPEVSPTTTPAPTTAPKPVPDDVITLE